MFIQLGVELANLAIVLHLVCLGILTGCFGRGSTQPNVIVVAVEGLGFNRVLCDEEGVERGFEMMCSESIRFTHAYTNSTTSLANLGSLLTGKLPEEHGLRGQSQWMRPSQILVSEIASERGYRTSLISGGPPLVSKTGLAQGFEMFDDRFDLNQRPYYRPAPKVSQIFLNWVDDAVSAESFLSFLYLNDALFPFIPSVGLDGEIKELSMAAKFSDVAEGLQVLIEGLKERGIWNSTYVVLVGLHGGEDPMNLKSAQTQVTLLIKPPRVQKDQATQWGVDHNVALIDVGATLFEILGAAMPESHKMELTSLSSVFNTPQPKWSRDRWVHTEGYWGFELFGTDIVNAVRKDHLLYVNGPQPMLYNTLTDRMETNPSRISDENLEVKEQLGPPLRNLTIPSWFSLGYRFFHGEEGEEELDMSSPEWSHPIAEAWKVRFYIENRSWGELEQLAYKMGRMDLEILAKFKQGLPLPKVSPDFCESVFTKDLWEFSIQHAREVCKADRLIYYLDWALAKGGESELFYENRFRKSFQNWWSKLELGAINYANRGTLGLPLTWPQMPDVSESYIIFRERRAQRYLLKTKKIF